MVLASLPLLPTSCQASAADLFTSAGKHTSGWPSVHRRFHNRRVFKQMLTVSFAGKYFEKDEGV